MVSSRSFRGAVVLALVAILGGCGGGGSESSGNDTGVPASAAAAAVGGGAAVDAAVAAVDRPPQDRARDASERPAAVLSFLGIAPGMQVLQLYAGDGYYTELLARAVGPAGVVYVTRLQDESRLGRLPNVRTVDDVARDIPAGSLDRVLLVAGYHLAVNVGIDRRVLFAGPIAALKAGGRLGIIDHSAIPGSGARDVGTLHRIDQALVVREVAALGFRPVGQLDALRNWNDNRTLLETDERIAGRTDRFVLLYERTATQRPPALPESELGQNELLEAGMPGGTDGTRHAAPVQTVVEDLRGRIDAYGDAVTEGQAPIEEEGSL